MVGVGFDKFLLRTGQHWFSGPGKRINDAAPREYPTLTWAHRGQDPKMVVRKAGGTSLIDQTLLTITPRMAWTDISDPGTASIEEGGGVNHSFHWRLAKTSSGYDEWIEDHNSHAVVTSGGGAQKFKDGREARLQVVATDTNNFQEQSYWKVNNYTQAETGGTAGYPAYSILDHINEYANGLPTSIYPGGAWSQFQGITTAEPGFSNYVPYQKSYANLTVNDRTNLINAFDHLYENLHFVPPPTKQEYYEAESGGPKLKAACVIFTDITGKVQLKQLCRASNDRWENETDAYFGAPTFGGCPIACPPSLETVQAFPTGTAGALGTMQTTTAGVGGSRYFLVNFNYYKTVYDADWHMRPFPGIDPQRPTRKLQWWYLGFNNFNISPRRHGCIFPSQNI